MLILLVSLAAKRKLSKISHRHLIAGSLSEIKLLISFTHLFNKIKSITICNDVRCNKKMMRDLFLNRFLKRWERIGKQTIKYQE